MLKQKFTLNDLPYDDKDGWADVLASYNNDKIRSLYQILSNGLFHTTTKNNFIQILQDKFIKPNTNGNKFNYEKARNNYGFLNSWVCLFDFNAEFHKLVNTCDSWMHFFSDYNPTIALRLNRDKLKKIIPFSYHYSLPREEQKFCIHEAESWYPEPIHISNIDEFIIIFNKYDPVKYCYIPPKEIQKFPDNLPDYKLSPYFDGILESRLRNT